MKMIETAMKRVGSRYGLTALVQRRVRELVRGMPPLVPVRPDASPIDIALQEIIEGKIRLPDGVLTGGEAGAPKEEARKKKR